MLPGAKILLMRRQDRPHVIPRTTGNRVPSTTLLSRIGKGSFSQHLAHGITLSAIGLTFRVLLIGIAVFVKHRSAHKFLHIGLGHDRCNTGRHHHSIHRFRLIDAIDNVIANPLHILHVIVGADVR